MSEKIVDNILQVGGGDLTYPGDAAIYLAYFENEAFLVDAGCGQGHSLLKKNILSSLPPGVQLKYLLLTHCHFDHTGGADAVRQDFGCRIVAHELDSVYLEAGDNEVTAASWYGTRLKPFSIDIKLQGKESEITVGGKSVRAIHWPGHSPGSVVYVTDIDDMRIVFAQDVHGPIHPVLLSDDEQYQKSLKKLLDLDADLLLEGHYGVIETQKEVRRFIRSFMR